MRLSASDRSGGRGRLAALPRMDRRGLRSLATHQL